MGKTRAGPQRKAAETAFDAPSLVHDDVDPPRVLHHFLKLSNRLMAPFTIHLEKRYRISVNEFRLLMLIGRYGPAASHELVELTGVNPMGVSRAAAALVQHGRVEFRSDPANRRRKILHLTPEGQHLYEAMRPNTEQVAAYLFESLRVDEIMAFDRFLKTMIERLEAVDDEGRLTFLERTRPDEGEEPAEG